MSYEPVSKALAAGADPAMLCATCPWDRFCVTPPTVTRAEIDAQFEEAKKQDEAQRIAAQSAGKDPGLPVGSLLTALTFGGRDTSAYICPVLALRLRSGKGGVIAAAVKTQMQGWDDDST